MSVVDRKILFLLVFTILLLSVSAFPDDDRDGIPNNFDSCPSSESKVVDRNGCDCTQKDCGVGACQVIDYQLQCLQTCDDGIQNQDEEGIDCGGSCQSCYQKSQVRNDNSSIDCTDCRKCGCMEGFTCDIDGSCKIQARRQGKLCKTQDFFYTLNKIDCKKKGPTWIKEDKAKFIRYEVSGFASGIPFVKDFVDEKARERFDEVTVCINTEDIGCATSEFKCFGENQLTEENKRKAEDLLESEITEQVDENIPWYADIVIDVEFDVDLSEYRVDIPYACSSQTTDSKDSCKALIKNGGLKKRLTSYS